MTQHTLTSLQETLFSRYADAPTVDADAADIDALLPMLARGSCRNFTDASVSPELLKLLCAAALASPTKSDLQQRDIILLQSADQRAKLAALVADQSWVANAPMILVFCGNNRRQRLMHHWHGVPFANDHLDMFMNAAADAAIALGAFVAAAEVLGLGCCPISAVRNQPRLVSEMLDLPKHVFPFAGLAIGYPQETPTISKRLPLNATCHIDRYTEENLRETIRTYDTERAKTQPYAAQRFPEAFGEPEIYGWSDDKTRQYSRPERADFGAYIRDQGFCLD